MLACIHTFIHPSIHSSQFSELILCYFSKHCRFNRIQRWMHSVHGYAWIRKFIHLCIMCHMSVKMLKFHFVQLFGCSRRDTNILIMFSFHVDCTHSMHYLTFILSMLPMIPMMKTATIPLKCIFSFSAGWGLWIFVEKLQTHL